MIYKIFLIVYISLFLTNFAHSKVDTSSSLDSSISSQIQNLPDSSNKELLILIDKQNEVINKQTQVIDRLNANYSQFKVSVR